MQDSDIPCTSRRGWLKQLGAGSALAVTGLAGCSGNGGGSGGDGNGGTATPESGGGSDGGGGATKTATKTSGETLKAAVLTPFSGSIGWLGPSTKKGAEVALADLEKTNGIDGVSDITLRSSDTKRDPATGIQVYQNLDAKNFDVVFGTTSTIMVSMLDTVKSVKLPVLTPGTTTRLNPVNSKWIWRTQSHDNVSGVAQALYAKQQFGDRIAVVTVNVRGPESFANAVSKSYEALGGTVVKKMTIKSDADSYRSTIEQLQDLDVDGVTLAASTNAAALFINNYNDLGASFPLILSNDASAQSLLDKTGVTDMSTLYGQVSGAGPANEYFVKRFKEVHGTDSIASLSQQGYDSMLMILAAVQQAGEVSREAIINQFGRQPQDAEKSVTNPPGEKVMKANNIKSTLKSAGDINLEGASTTINFDKNHNLWGGIRVLSVSGGEWQVTNTYPESKLRTAIDQ